MNDKQKDFLNKFISTIAVLTNLAGIIAIVFRIIRDGSDPIFGVLIMFIGLASIILVLVSLIASFYMFKKERWSSITVAIVTFILSAGYNRLFLIPLILVVCNIIIQWKRK